MSSRDYDFREAWSWPGGLVGQESLRIGAQGIGGKKLDLPSLLESNKASEVATKAKREESLGF
jgi:hypothetical protein